MSVLSPQSLYPIQPNQPGGNGLADPTSMMYYPPMNANAMSDIFHDVVFVEVPDHYANTLEGPTGNELGAASEGALVAPPVGNADLQANLVNASIARFVGGNPSKSFYLSYLPTH